MPRPTKAEQEKIDNEIVSLEIPRRVAERIKFLASLEKRSVADFLDIAIEEGRDISGDLFSVILKIDGHPSDKEVFANVRGNPDLLIRWLKSNNIKIHQDEVTQSQY